MGEKFYITTPIFYANSNPHIGNAYSVVLSDIIARYQRMQDKDVFFLTGTAEHGEKIIRSAMAGGLGPQVFVDKNVKKFLELYEKLNISNDEFIRNSDKEKHWPGAKLLWERMVGAGDIYKKSYKGLYCVGCEKFITKKELAHGKCPDHDKEPEEVKEENYFFRLSKYQKEIIQILKDGVIEIFPHGRVNELLAFVKEGLEDISFSRPEGPIPWGIPVPQDSSHIMYVWCEELSNYLSALGYGREDDSNFEKFWPADLHIVGKDILRFHGIVLPAMLISAGISQPKKIMAHGMIVSGGKKMSKTIGNTVDPNDYIEKFGADAFRYFLAREISPFEDGDFTDERFIETYNANLANGLGNLVSRTLKMAEIYFENSVSRKTLVDVPVTNTLSTMSGNLKTQGYSIPYIFKNILFDEYTKAMESFKINDAADVIWKGIATLDLYITDNKPFKLIEEDKEKTENIVWSLLYGLNLISYMILPIMPNTGEKIKKLLGAEISDDGEPISFRTQSLKEPMFKRV